MTFVEYNHETSIIFKVLRNLISSNQKYSNVHITFRIESNAK